jgi:hypothetical protein
VTKEDRTMKKTVEEFITYLENTLIPDLYESGRDATAEDFETCIKHMRELMRGGKR